MLGITTMKLYQEWAACPSPETENIIVSNKELLIVGMSATGKKHLLCFLPMTSSYLLLYDSS